MKTISRLSPLLLTLAAVSCTPDHPPATTAPTPSYVSPQTNPVYDTPAAYEETSASPVSTPGVDAIPTTLPEANQTLTTPRPTASVNGAAIIHTVVAGDTLSGISAKYKVPVAAIKAANRMTKDTVILGKKMAIPPAR
jgi:LysM repeat protein